MLDETIMKKQYVTPALTVTAIKLTDVIMTSPIENYSQIVIDDGDWGDDINDPIAGS